MSRRILSCCLCFGIHALALGCGGKSGPPPAAAEKPRSESKLSHTTLSFAARKSLNIQTVPIRVEPVQSHLSMTGWVMAKPGNEVVLTAPVPGYVQRVKDAKNWPIPGQSVKAGDTLMQVEPVLSPLEQVQLAALQRDVINGLEKAKESITVAEKELERVLTLHKQGLRGSQDVELARAQLKFAQEDQAGARDKLKLFLSAEKGTALPPVAVRAPLTGIVTLMPASPGQYVPASAPLMTIIDLSPTWLRVPIPELELPRVDVKQPIVIMLTANRRFEAKPIALVPQVDPLRHTADLIYEIGKPVHPAKGERPVPWAKDQMVKVLVPIGVKQKETVVPYAAIVFDSRGGGWVYIDKTQKSDSVHIYERRRVDLGPTVDGGVVVQGQFQKDEQVVSDGAAAIFSREFFRPPVTPGSAGKGSAH